MSILSHSPAARALAALALAAGLVLAVPEPARSEPAGIVLVDRDHRGHRGRNDWRDDRHHDRGHWRGKWRHDGHRHWRRGPPPRIHHHYHGPHWRSYYRHCRVEWNFWYGGYVRVCV